MPVPEGQYLNLEAKEAAPAPTSTCYLEETHSESLLPGLDDPLASMNSLAAAAELPQARLLPSLGTRVPAGEKLDTAPSLVLEYSFLQGITLLSEITELELDQKGQEVADPESNLVLRPSMESLLVASSHMLKDVLESPFTDPLKNLQLPCDLNSKKCIARCTRKRNGFCYEVFLGCSGAGCDWQRSRGWQRELVKLQRLWDSENRHEDAHRSLAHRGPGRPPRKETHTLSALSPPCKREKCHSGSGKLSSKPLLTSEDYDLATGVRKRH